MLRRALVVVAAVGVGAVLLAGCSDGDGGQSPTTTAPQGIVGATTSTTTTTDGGAAGADRPRVVQFDAASEVACTGDTADVAVSYSTSNVAAVAFAVDGVPVVGSPVPTSGESTVPVPCDGRVHTVMLIGSSGADPVFATKAVATRPT